MEPNIVDEKQKITPSQYFDFIKDAKNTITTKTLEDSYPVFVTLAEKYNRLGQTESLKKLAFLADTLMKEEKLIEMGITTYVYKDTIEDYIENVADKAVKMVELSRYMREIPDELVDTIEAVRPIFDQIYVVFTDYTGKEERKIEKERRDKDPILFGVFKTDRTVSDRFYFLGDWVDEYCDLTLDKMVEEYETKKETSPLNNIECPKTTQELVELLKKYTFDPTDKKVFLSQNVDSQPQSLTANLPVNNMKLTDTPQRKSFFDKVRSVFNKQN